MRKSFITTTAFAAMAMAMFASSAQAEIDIDQAKIQNGQVFVSGSHAQRGSSIAWEGIPLGINSSNGGSFSFTTTNLPQDCVGRLTIGTEERDVVINNCTANITIIQGGVRKTGQTQSWAVGDDGAFQKGVVPPNPRFTDNANGTVTDNLTGLIWLKKMDCLGPQTWANAISAANTLADGHVACGLTDGSVAGDWRLPNLNELTSLLDLGQTRPTFPVVHPFTDFFGDSHWSSTSAAMEPNGVAWLVDFFDGHTVMVAKTTGAHITAVRGGQ
jgi:hypothetical protein